MDHSNIKEKLEKYGYVVVKGILSQDEIDTAKDMFYRWQKSVPDLDRIHQKCDPHGIYKFHEVGHQRHAWEIRKNQKIQSVFRNLWGCKELVVSFDGSCHIEKECKKKDNIWTHTDQAPNQKGLKCYQGFVSLTSNQERTLVVYKRSHNLHENYFKDRGIVSSKNWQLIDRDYLKSIAARKRVLNVPAGSLVLWDSRCFHQNQYGKANSEERIVQYVCFLPKTKEYTEAQRKKKLNYLKERRTTSHWPYPIRVNSKQPQNYGDASLTIDYDSLPVPELEYMKEEINKII